MIDGWSTVSSTVQYTGVRVVVRRDSVRRADQSLGTYEYTESVDGVRVVALDDRGRIALVEENVYVCGHRLLMCPGGGCQPDEDPLTAARREPEEGVTGIAKDRDAPAILGDASLAYLIPIQTTDGDRPEDKQWEWTVHAFGERGPKLAEQLAATVRAWDRHIRADENDQHADPVLTVHPAGTPDALLPAGDIVDKEHSRLVFRWPGHDVLLARPVEHSGADVAREGV